MNLGAIIGLVMGIARRRARAQLAVMVKPALNSKPAMTVISMPVVVVTLIARRRALVQLAVMG